jgi:hypothetical protein
MDRLKYSPEDRLWGVLFLSIIMVVLYVLASSWNKTYSSPYFVLWIFFAYKAFTGDGYSIKSVAKWIFWINAIGLFWIAFADSKIDFKYLGFGSKNDLVLGLIWSCIIYAGLYLYLDRHLSQTKTIHPNNLTQHLEVVDNSDCSPSARAVHSSDYDYAWKEAFVELQSEKKNIGLWARLFSEANGNENIARANYMRIRAIEIIEAPSVPTHAPFGPSNSIDVERKKSGIGVSEGDWVKFKASDFQNPVDGGFLYKIGRVVGTIYSAVGSLLGSIFVILIVVVQT